MYMVLVLHQVVPDPADIKWSLENANISPSHKQQSTLKFQLDYHYHVLQGRYCTKLQELYRKLETCYYPVRPERLPGQRHCKVYRLQAQLYGKVHRPRFNLSQMLGTPGTFE